MILLGLTATGARAGVIITASDVMLAPGGTGTMDFSIASNSNDTLSQFGLGLNITPVGSATSLLQFTSSQTDPYSNPNYVFSGNSFGSDFNTPFWFPPTTTTTANDTISGADSDDNAFLNYPSITGSLYLATVQFQAAPGATVGDQFQISLVANPVFTYFDDGNGNILSYSSSSNGGVVTISSAIPEPASLTLLAISSVMGLLCYRLRQTRGRSQSSPSDASIHTSRG